MPDPTASSTGMTSSALPGGHRLWVRVCHWTIVLGFLTLAITGVIILMAHPRLYWGEVGNDLMPALIEIPISNNHRPAELEHTLSFTNVPGAPASADRVYSIFNQNGWSWYAGI